LISSFFRGIDFLFIDEPKTSLPLPSAATTTAKATTKTTNSISKATFNPNLFGRDPIDLAALSLLLAEHHQQNLSLALLQGQNHKSLFSDDDARKNNANRFSFILINLISFSFLYIIF
jgi:hypothetical protein